MAMQTVSTAKLACSMGSSTSCLGVLPTHKAKSGGQFAANIMDHKPSENIKPFGVCMSLGNPAVAAATAAAQGSLTPMPCKPNTSSPWVPGSPTVILDGAPALNNTSKLSCAWGGTISIVAPGQTTNTVP